MDTTSDSKQQMAKAGEEVDGWTYRVSCPAGASERIPSSCWLDVVEEEP